MNAFNLHPGTVVAIDTSFGLLPVRHVGVLSDRTDQHGYPFVFSASLRSGRTLEEHWDVFRGGRQGLMLDLWGSLSSAEIVERARRKLGVGYDVASWNCEHYVRYCHGLPVESPQLRLGVGLAAGAVAVTAIAAALWRN